MELIIFDSTDQWLEANRELLWASSAESDTTLSIALAGGSTPLKWYKEWPTYTLNWQKVWLFQGDERVTTDPLLLNQVAFVQAVGKDFIDRVGKTVFFSVDKPDMKPLMAEQLPQQLDLVLLGVGEDGHIASIFSQHDYEGSDQVITTTQHVHPAPYRVSLSVATILHAKQILLLASSQKKLELLREVVAGGHQHTPVAKLLQHHSCTAHILISHD